MSPGTTPRRPRRRTRNGRCTSRRGGSRQGSWRHAGPSGMGLQFWTWAAVRPGASSPSPRRENEQIECACGSVSGAAPIGVRPPLPGGPLTSPASASSRGQACHKSGGCNCKAEPRLPGVWIEARSTPSLGRREQRRRCAHRSRRALNPGHRERGPGEGHSGAVSSTPGH